MYRPIYRWFALSNTTLGVLPANLNATSLIIATPVIFRGLQVNSAAILTDAFPETERGTALGINQITGTAGGFLGVVVGALISQVGWRRVFLFNVPIGIAGTVWSYWKLRELGARTRAPMDWFGNAAFALGLLLVGITYGIRPYGRHPTG